MEITTRIINVTVGRKGSEMTNVIFHIRLIDPLLKNRVEKDRSKQLTGIDFGVGLTAHGSEVAALNTLARSIT